MQRQTARGFGRVSPEHAETFLGIMSILHEEAAAPAFARLLKKQLQSDDYVLLAHLFEEISVLMLHNLIPEVLVVDALEFDLYWDELREEILSQRRQTGNEKFCENFEIASDCARDYRNDRPPIRRWDHKPEGDDPPRSSGGTGRRAPAPAPTSHTHEPATRRRG